MRLCLLFLFAVSTFAVFSAAETKLEDLSPEAQEFLKKRDKFIESLDAESEVFFKSIPGGKELREYLVKYITWVEKYKKVGPAPTLSDVAQSAHLKYAGKYYGKQSKRLSEFNGAYPDEFNELYDNGFIQYNNYVPFRKMPKNV